MEETIKHREKKVPINTRIDISETFELTEKDFDKLSLTGKFSAIWNQKYVDLNIYNYTHFAGLAFFLYVSFSGLIMMSNYILPEMTLSPESLYWHNVACFYLCYINIAHWICVLCYKSYWTPADKDQIKLAHKTLWDDYDQTIKSLTETRVLVTDTNESRSNRRMIDYVADEVTGLQWRYCVICQHDTPPRSHHCVICNRCILKRDHHCYMTGRCIGYRNQRYFYFLCIFSALSCIVCFIGQSWYLFKNDKKLINNRLGTLFIPITIYQWIWLQEISSHVFLMISHLYIYTLVGSMCFSFVALQSIMILRGITSDEMKHGAKVKVNIGIKQRWQDVFGEWWILNFIMPSQILFRQSGDGEQWPGLVNLDGLVALKEIRVSA